MTRTVTGIILLLVLSACNSGGPGMAGLRPNTGTNEAAQANLNLAIEYMRLGDYERSLEKLNRAREADPEYSGIYNAYGLLYQSIGKPGEADRSFRRALKLNPGDSATMNNYGRFLCQQGDIDRAEQTFLDASENPLYATPEVAITNAGTCVLGNGDQEKAEYYFRKALETNPEMPQALLQMAQLAYAGEKLLSARAYLQRFRDVSRQTPASLWLGIQVENRLGDKDAMASYKLSLRNNYPDSNEAQALAESGL